MLVDTGIRIHFPTELIFILILLHFLILLSFSCVTDRIPKLIVLYFLIWKFFASILIIGRASYNQIYVFAWLIELFSLLE